MSRLDEIDEWLNHEPCCDHAGADEHGCWECLNTGHTHGSTITFEDARALVKFAREVRDITRSDLRATLALVEIEALLNDLENPS